MKKFILILISCGLVSANMIIAQCPEKGLLWKRLVYLSDPSIEATPQQLKELLDYKERMKNCVLSGDSTHAFLLQRIGAYYYKQNDFIAAINYTKHAIDLINLHKGKPSINYRHIIKNYYNLSVFYESLDNLTERNRAIDSCVTIANRLKAVEPSSIYLLNKRVQYLFNIGDYQHCYNYAILGEEVSKNYSGGYNYEYALIFWTWKINVLLIFKQFGAVEQLLNKKLNELKRTGAIASFASLYQQFGKLELQKENPVKALSYYKKAFKSAQKAGDYAGCVQALNNMGYEIYYRIDRDNEKALECYKQALTYLKKYDLNNIDLAFESLNTLTNIANVYVQKDEYDSANIYFQLAFDQIQPGFNERTLVYDSLNIVLAGSHNNIDYLINLILDKADAHLKWYKKNNETSFGNEALRIYKAADLLLQRIKGEQSEMKSKLFWRSNSRRLYEHAIEASFMVNNMDDAFFFFEKSRAVLLIDQLNEHNGMAENDISHQLQLKKIILKNERALNEEKPGSERYVELQSLLIRDKQELDRIRNTIKNNNPLYYQSFFDTSFISVKDVRDNILLSHDGMVELFVGDSAVYIMVITRKEIKITSINKTKFEKLVNAYNSYISDPGKLNREFETFIETSGQLYQLLFHKTKLPSGRIIISPDGQHFPFEALVKSKQRKNLSYFINDYAVTYTYSARYLLNQFNVIAKQPGSRDFIGFAPVHYPSSSGLVPLPRSKHSLQLIQTNFSKPTILLDKNATRNNFLEEFSNYKIIQLYTHAAESGSTGEPTIYFYDSALYLSDLIPERKPLAELIILSACETGKGKLYQGEGVFSFNRGFAALGIPASIINLWAVDDASTYLLTELFYKYLSEEMPADVALQKAKIEFIDHASKQQQLPYYWAAAIVTGKVSSIPIQKKFPWAVMLIVVPVMGVVIWRLKNKNKIIK